MKRYVFLILCFTGCGDSGNRVVDVNDAAIAPQTAVEAQKAAESDLPKP